MTTKQKEDKSSVKVLKQRPPKLKEGAIINCIDGNDYNDDFFGHVYAIELKPSGEITRTNIDEPGIKENASMYCNIRNKGEEHGPRALIDLVDFSKSLKVTRFWNLEHQKGGYVKVKAPNSGFYLHDVVMNLSKNDKTNGFVVHHANTNPFINVRKALLIVDRKTHGEIHSKLRKLEAQLNLNEHKTFENWLNHNVLAKMQDVKNPGNNKENARRVELYLELLDSYLKVE